jgi:hypothetical protein
MSGPRLLDLYPAQAGWDVNGWADFQPSTAETEERSRKAREAAQIRWAKHRDRKRPRAI